MSDREAKNALFDAFAEVAKALASGRRAEIVDVLAQGERSVDDIAGEIDQSVANTSHHLQALAARRSLGKPPGGNAHVLCPREPASRGTLVVATRCRRRTRCRHREAQHLISRRPARHRGDNTRRTRVPAATAQCRRARRASDSRVRRRTHPRRPVGAARPSAPAPPRDPQGQRHRRVLPWTVLRVRRRGCQESPAPRYSGPTPRGWFSRMETCRPRIPVGERGGA